MNHHLKTIILFLLLHAPLAVVRAAPAKATTRTVRLAGGQAATLHLVGDEHHHAWCAADGTPHLPRPDGRWQPATTQQTDSMLQRWRQAHNQADTRRRRRAPQHAAANLGQPTTYTGRKRGLVLLVEFPDLKMTAAATRDEFHDMFNRRGYDHYGHIGSVRDYFRDQSYGRLKIDFDVVGPLTVSLDMAYYGGNNGFGGSDRHARQMVAEACRLADAQVNYADYDWDGDGEVDQVFCIYAGYGENAGAPAYTIWPHEFNLGTDDAWGGGHLTLDGVTIDTYACSCELAGSRGTTLNGIGTACHEFSHCLGLPDFYDVSYTGGPGMGCWDLMDSGSHAGPEGNGEVPYGFSAYERWFAGWLTFAEVGHSRHLADIPDVGDKPVAYVVRNPDCPDEYFILENHQPTRWFAWAGTTEGCHGLMVTHVDYDPERWQANRVNNNNRHQCMSIVPADASYGTLSAGRYYTDDGERRGDLFPGLQGATTLERQSHTQVGGILYQPTPADPQPISLILHTITETDGNVSLYVTNPDSIYPPANITATQTTAHAFKAKWDDVPHAEAYDIELTHIISSKPFKTATELITGITATNHDFSDIAERQVRIKVRAIVGGTPSHWSSSTTLQLNTDDIAHTKSDPTRPETFSIAGTSLSSHHTPTVVIVRQGNKTRKVATIKR